MKLRNNTGKHVAKAALALSLAAALSAGSFPAGIWAKEQAVLPSKESLLAMEVERPLAYKSEAARKAVISEAAALPSKVDLRAFDNGNGIKDYTTGIKNQNPWGTCWGFASIAASETSILGEKDLTAEEYNKNEGREMDLSEKHLAWYNSHAITDADVCRNVPASQVGEGVDFTKLEKASGDPNCCYNRDGFMFNATGLFASGAGPVLEHTKFEGEEDPYPFEYRGKEGTDVIGLFTDDSKKDEALEYTKKYVIAHYRSYYETPEDAEKDMQDPEKVEEFYQYYRNIYTRKKEAGDILYSEFDDWSLPNDHQHRFDVEGYVLQESTLLESPAIRSDKGAYLYTDMANVDAIKTELYNKRPVTIGFHADQSRPGDPLGDRGYMNTANWAQYTNDDVVANHAVTIIGYDDNYSKENFTRTVSGAAVEGSTPPGDGAFIIRNSWGYDWGNRGYFYLSYYDHTIESPESFDFYTREDLDEGRVEFIPDNSSDYKVSQYDFLPADSVYSMSDSEEAYMANVFTMDEDAVLEGVSTQTASPDTTVEWYVIALNNNYTDPTDGRLIARGEKTFEHGGYHRIDLPIEERFPIPAGQNFSVVMHHKVPVDNGQVSYEILCNNRIDDSSDITIKGIVNRGESLLYRDGGWIDWKDITDILRSSYKEFAVDFTFDNFAIKAYSTPSDKVYFINTDVTLSAKEFNKKGISYPILGVTGTGKVTGKVVKGNKKYISVSKDGILTVKKGAKKGTYKVKVKVQKNDRYDAAEEPIIVRVTK